MLEIRCPACQKRIRWMAEDPARFCQGCGARLPEAIEDVTSDSAGGDPAGRTESDSDRRTPVAPEPSSSETIPPSNKDSLRTEPTVAPGELEEPPRPIDPASLPRRGAQDSATIAPSTIPVAPTPHSRELGELVGPYRLVRLIGAGGMGVVWEAIEVETGRRVAVKRLSNSMVTDPESHQRFVREAQTAARISHPNVTFIFGAGEQDGIPYIAMELMPGTTLADVVAKDGPLDSRHAVDRILEAIEGLMAAHELGLIHRDVKPSNCFLTSAETVKIGDFGLSKSMQTSEVDLTKTGTFMGTPSYSAPEQIRGGELDNRTDVYAVGATLYNLLTGQNPFMGDALQVTAQILSDEPKPPTAVNPKIPVDLERIILKCIEKEPAKRFQDLAELRTALIPFASRGTSLANFGRRLGSFLTDYLLVQIAMLVLIILAAVWIRLNVVPQGRDAVELAISRVSFLWMLGTWFLSVGYFGIQEGLSGKTFGKKILGLSVVDAQGQRPGIAKSMLRAVVIPGGFGLTLAFGFYQAFYLLPPTDAAGIFVSIVAWFTAQALIMSLCLLPMRAENDFRGVHEWLSGTRVLWQASDAMERLHIGKVQPTANTIKKLRIGPYESNELLGTSRLGKVYLSYDETLRRQIWLVVSGEGAGPRQARINLSRPTRQRWLAGGVDPEHGRWDAIQAVDGLPIQAVVGINPSINWKHYRMIIKQVADELKACLEDENLPTQLTLPQVWVDDHCRAVLLDRRLVNLVDDESELESADAQLSPEHRAARLLQQLGDLIIRTQQKQLPRSAQVFLKQLANKPKTEKTIDWAIDELDGMSDQLATMDWDSRAGILGSSIGLEFLTYGIVAAGFYILCLNNLTSALWIRFLAGTLFSLTLPTIFGMWFRGGLVFQVMSVNVCDKSGNLASPIQCGLRSMLAWIPPMAFVGFGILISLAGESRMVGTAEANTVDEMLRESSTFLLVVLFWAFSLLSLNAAGVMFALRSPCRGLQDYCAGTKLIPD